MNEGTIVQKGNAFHCGECFQVYFKRDNKTLPGQCKKCSHVFSDKDHKAYRELRILGGFLAIDETAYRAAVKANDVSNWLNKRK
ncbi:hypothetical protein [Pseudalkalibacillus caeni]|uniref:Uncharacterized protein n=1 Tax=Exobacillus caeni TaxID=2574798 RepID=A0A5R9FCI1_9BACL|nr:hypothetical protein [Pseudalkalibacillus caeni]TLS38583.1 hypothetical protein FCL54_03530 [Pseudalkalibacillus caeni]